MFRWDQTYIQLGANTNLQNIESIIAMCAIKWKVKYEMFTLTWNALDDRHTNREHEDT
jgi:predicted HTH transcriptional regulator